NVYPPSADLSGAIVQVNDYCYLLREDILRIKKDGLELNAFNPRRVVIIGNYARELTEARKRTSFELFRTSLAGIDIITFDEFFNKVGQLAKLFNLIRSDAPEDLN
ncbi:MAG: Shedu anti-phage system protein SduA domain-containing protein, partial [Rhodomicrobium sp.]